MVCLRYTQLYLACGIDNQRTAFSFQNCGTRPDQKFGMNLVTKGFLKLKLPKKKNNFNKKNAPKLLSGASKTSKNWGTNVARQRCPAAPFIQTKYGGGNCPPAPPFIAYTSLKTEMERFR